MEIKKEYNLEQIIDDLQVGINASNNGSTNKVKINVMLAVEIVEVLKEINNREQKRLHDYFDRARNKPESDAHNIKDKTSVEQQMQKKLEQQIYDACKPETKVRENKTNV